jgi:hypothetical protein
MLAAGVTPDFPRPKPPRSWLPLLVLAVVPVFSAVAALGTNRARAAFAKPPYSERAALVRVAFAGRDRDLLALARATRDTELARLLRREYIARYRAEHPTSETRTGAPDHQDHHSQAAQASEPSAQSLDSPAPQTSMAHP